MRILGIALVFICTLAFVVIGTLMVAFSFDLFSLENITDFIHQTLQIKDLTVIVSGIGLFLILSSIFIAQITLGRIQREKTIAFNNPDGQVTVSLAAIEDFVKRISTNISEIRELRSDVIAGKSGIEINTRLSLWAGVTIPETTENIQKIIKNRIQEMLGIEEPIIVRVHVAKIVHKEEKKRVKKKGKEEEVNPSTFRGSIEYGKD